MPSSPIEPIRTARLRLRPLTDTDIPALLAYRGDPEVCRYLPFDAMTEARLRERLDADLGGDTLPDDGGSVTLGVEPIEGGPLIGDVVLFHTSAEHRQGEVGYVFNPAAAGQGYASEATAAMIDLAFDADRGLGLHRVVARIDSRNAASIRLAERLGMRAEGHFREVLWEHDAWVDMVIFAVLSSDWGRSTTR